MSVEKACRRSAWAEWCLTVVVTLACSARAGEASATKVVWPDGGHPFLACTPGELGRLRQAYRTAGAGQDIVAARVREARRFVNDPIEFPPRGGQHNQWYQCDQCETGLRTIDATHHQCPRCGKVYSGPPYDDVIFSRQHGRNLQQMLTAAWAYAISEDRRFAAYVARVLVGYAQRYEQYPYHSASLDPKSRSGGHLFEQTLNEAADLATEIGPAYDLIHDSGVLSAADHRTIREGLLLPMLRNIDKNKTGKNNWQTWHDAGLVWGGALIGDPAWVQKAIDDPQNGFLYQMKVSVSQEGMWYENSWGYHFYTLGALVNLAETGRRLGLDLWSHERLHKMFTLPVSYTMADGMLPRFGDDVGSSVRRVGRLFEPAYQAYRDPQILALLSDRASFESLLLDRTEPPAAKPLAAESMVFPDAGHAILRSKGEAGLTAALTFGPYGGFHGHLDKLSFVLFGFAKELGVDPGRARSQAYRLAIHSLWYKATVSHNTVLVDGQSQKPAAGKLLWFEPGSAYSAVAASCEEAYPDVKHTRWLVLTGTYLLVIDRLQAQAEHQFTWLYHNRGTQVVCAAAQDPTSLAGIVPGGEYIHQAQRGTTDGVIRARFDGTVATYLTMAAHEGTVVTVGNGVGGSVEDRVPMIMIGRQGREACFAAVLEPAPIGGAAHVSDIRLTTTAETLALAVEGPRGTDHLTIQPDGGLAVILAR
jgi:Heparinase II/III-like protein/Alginate lyase